mgnify:CR=1 FL=1
MGYKFERRACNICGSYEKVFIGRRIPRACRIDDSLIVDIFKCRKCGLVYPDPMPIPEVKQFEENYGNPDIYFPTVISEKRLKFYESIVKKIENYTSTRNGRLLDVGCGRGELLHVAKKYGWNTFGAEVSKTFAEYAHKRFDLDVRVGNLKDIGFASQSFDVVCLIAVIQHAQDPRSLINEINRILKNGGILFLETMNNESLLYKLGDAYYKLQGKRITTHLSPTFPCYQVYGFSKKSISYLLKNSGFSVIDMRIKGGISTTEKVEIKTLREKILRLIRTACFLIADLFHSGQVLLTCAKKEKKVLFVTNGTKLAPATRYRVYEFLPYLEKNGIKYCVYSMFSERLTSRMIRSSTFSGLDRVLCYAHMFIERFLRSWKIIFMSSGFDIVFLQRATFPLGLEKILRLRNRNIIFDIDDAIYLPDRNEPGFIGFIKRLAKKNEVISVLKISKCAIAENQYIKDFISRYCSRIFILAGPIDTVKNFAKENYEDKNVATIGWIGTPSTAFYLQMLERPLRELAGNFKIRVILIGAGQYNIKGVEVHNIEWSEKTEIRNLHEIDIGVMPMPDNEWTRGKLGCKMLQYMANGIPCVISFTPTTASAVKDGVNGFLASGDKDWIKKLSLLIKDAGLRRRIGLAGRKTAEEIFSIDNNGPKLLEIIKDMQ